MFSFHQLLGGSVNFGNEKYVINLMKCIASRATFQKDPSNWWCVFIGVVISTELSDAVNSHLSQFYETQFLSKPLLSIRWKWFEHFRNFLNCACLNAARTETFFPLDMKCHSTWDHVENWTKWGVTFNLNWFNSVLVLFRFYIHSMEQK